MKIALLIAYVPAVTNLMLNQGEDLVPAISLKLESEVEPKLLEELREGLMERFFDAVEKGPAVPAIPELEACAWKTEYEKGRLVLDLSDTQGLAYPTDEPLEFQGVDVKAITFEAKPTGMLAFSCNAIVRADEDGRGKLTALLKHNVKATFTKLTQKPLAEPKKPKDDAAQGDLLVDPPKDAAPPADVPENLVPLVH